MKIEIIAQKYSLFMLIFLLLNINNEFDKIYDEILFRINKLILTSISIGLTLPISQPPISPASTFPARPVDLYTLYPIILALQQ